MLISIITPVLNKAPYIARCFASLAAQKHDYFEHIIIDGGSKDGTVELIKEYASDHANVTWISKPDRGQSHAMNRGLELAQGDVIGFLNADDYYEPDIFSAVVSNLGSMKAPAMLFGNCRILNDCLEIWGVNKPEVADIVEWLLPSGAKFIPVNPVQYFYTADVHSLIGYFDEHQHYTMDIDFLFRAVQVSSCRYLDCVFGTFMLISGTKTLSDMQASTADARFAQLRRKYIESLSFRMRLIYEIRRIHAGLLAE